MSYTYLLESGEEYSAASFLDIPPSVLSRLNLTAEKSYSKGSETESCQSSQSGTMFAPSTGLRGKEKSILFAEDSLAKTSQAQGGGVDSMEIKAGYGPRWQGSLAKYNPNIYSWKTRQCLLFEESGECLEIFPRWGMMLGGELSELISPVTITDEKDYGLLPTPIATDWKGGTTSRRKDNGKLRFDQWRDFVKLKYGMTYPHPTHSELRMGFPQEWTDLKPLATDKFRLWLQRHSAFLATEDEMI